MKIDIKRLGIVFFLVILLTVSSGKKTKKGKKSKNREGKEKVNIDQDATKNEKKKSSAAEWLKRKLEYSENKKKAQQKARRIIENARNGDEDDQSMSDSIRSKAAGLVEGILGKANELKKKLVPYVKAKAKEGKQSFADVENFFYNEFIEMAEGLWKDHSPKLKDFFDKHEKKRRKDNVYNT